MKTIIRVRKLLLLLCLQCIAGGLWAQCPTSSFTISSPVCVGSALQITNTSVGGIDYKWDFSSGFFSSTGTKVADTLLNLSYPGDITQMYQNDTMVLFVSGLADSKLYRITYGDGPGNAVTNVEDLGTLGVLYQPSDVAFYYENSTYYGFVIDNGSNYLYKFRLGSTIFGTPDSVSVVLTNATSNFNSPRSIKIQRDSTGNIYGIVGNHGNGSINILDFGNSIHNTPVASAPIATGAGSAKDAVLAHTCGNWYAFIGCNNGIKRADFGSSLSNAPVFTTINSSGALSDLVLINDGPNWKLLGTDDQSWIVRKFDLGSDITNISPASIGTDMVTGYQAPKGICYARSGQSSYIYTLNESKRIITLEYTNSIDVNTATSTDFEPAGVTFNTAGSYPVTLFITNANGEYSTYTDTIDISTAPVTAFSTSGYCFGDVTTFTDSSSINNGTIGSWEWDFGDGNTDSSPNTNHQYSAPGNYVISLVTASSGGCADTLTDTILISTTPVASFLSPSAVCSMTGMQFTDQSTDSLGTISQWLWDFGNGDTLTTQNPMYAYPSGGTFNVSLTVTSAQGCSASTNSQLLINDRPSAGFSVTNTCVGQVVQFTDETVLSNSQIQNYAWDFGDGGSDSQQNPTHTYSGGVVNYNVSLIVTAVNGCIDTAIQDVKINNVPNALFTFGPNIICSNTDVNFTDLSSVAGDTISGWLWDFGNNETDSVKNPVHRFTTPGTHTVTLISYSPSSCPGAAFQQNVIVQESPSAAFSYSTTCLGSSTIFTNNTTPAPGSSIDAVIWTFNGQDSSAIYNPTYLFQSGGSFPVTLFVTSTDGCTDLITTNVDIHENPVASFNHTLPCAGNAVQFTNTSQCDTSSTFTQYDWSFGDLASGSLNYSTLQNPSHNYSATGSYIASLIATTNFGCSDTVFQTLNVSQSPTANFTYSPTCFGDLMEFFNPGNSNDSTYLWNFGDNQTNQLREPAHYYAYPGSYTVRLNVMAKSGCQASATKQVSVSPIPVADFLTTPACINSPYQIIDNSTISTGTINNWEWIVDGQTLPAQTNNPSTTFTALGAHNVSLTVVSDIGCSKSTTKIIDAYPLPESSFSFDPQFGTPPLEIQLTDLSTGAQTYAWSFGDGSPVETLQEPTHIYADTGWFTITQTVTSQYGCINSSDKNIYVIKPVLDVAVTGDSSYFDGEYFHIVAYIENRGTREITNLQMEANLENGNTISEQFTEVMPTGASGIRQYNFHASFLVSDAGSFNYYCIRALNPNGEADSNPGDNERCFNLTDQMILLNPYPNPFNNILHLKFLLPKSDNMNVQLIDASGKMIQTLYDGKAPKNLFEVKSDLQHLRVGTYSVRIRYRDNVVVKSVVKR